MKTLKFFVLIALIFTGAMSKAQKPIEVSEDTVSFKNAKYPGLVVTIPEYNFEKVKKNWIKELESGTKSKMVTEADEMTIFGANLKKVSPNPVNIFSKFINRDTILLLGVVLELGREKYVERSTGENELTEVKNFLRKFAKDQYLDFVEEELKLKNKDLKDLENELESFQNRKLKINRSIESNKTDIAEAEIKITMMNNEADKLTNEIIEQRGVLASMEAGVAKDQKEGYIKDSEKAKKKLVKDVESSRNKITKMKSEIEQFEDDIVKNESDQKIMKEKISQQELIVNKCEEKLATIKAY
jgi:peptidoglycan hydrolase CwlO-like protein